jgi:mono/diheme cytochrome c family protein
MPPAKLSGVDLDGVVELVYAQSGAPDVDRALVAKGRAVFKGAGKCSGCHSFDPDDQDEAGPNLGGRGNPATLAEFIGRPDHPRWFGKDSQMPPFFDKYDRATREEIGRYLFWLGRQR